MAQMLPAALMGAQERSTEAVKGDVYTRRWSTVQGKGKKKKVVEHELHVNPGSVGLGAIGLAVGAGVAGLGAALALRFSGKEVKTGDKLVRRMVDEYQPVTEEVKVIDIPARTVPTTSPGTYEDQRVWNPITHRYEDISVWVPGQTTYTTEAEVSHMETRTKSAYRVVVMSNNFVPHGTYPDLTEALLKMQSRYRNPHDLMERTEKMQWVTIAGKRVLRHFYEFKVDGLSIKDKEKDTDWWNPLGL